MSNIVLKEFPFLSGTELHLMMQKHMTVLFHLFALIFLGGDLEYFKFGVFYLSSCLFSAITDMSSTNNNNATVRYLVPKSFINNWQFKSSMKHANSGPYNNLPCLKLSLTIA